MHHCRAPVSRNVKEDVLSPILTDCGLVVRKTMIQLQRRVLTPCSTSLVMSLDGMIVLKAELLITDEQCRCLPPPDVPGMSVGAGRWHAQLLTHCGR